MKPTALLVEDESLLREQLREMLRAAWPELEVTGCVGDGMKAVAALDRLKPDVMFLDVEMPEMSGLEVARRASGRCHVAFVTAYSQYAVQAFDAGAVDYVLKPVDMQRLGLVCRRLQDRIASPPARLEGVLAQLASRLVHGPEYLRWITVSRGQQVVLVTADEVCYFQSDSKYTRVATRDHDYLISMTVKDLLQQLDPVSFWQVHRSTIVNAQSVESVSRDGAGHWQLRLKGRPESLRVSQPFAGRFRQM
jgi:DNA-binding LytR/AlgR family response regulator